MQLGEWYAVACWPLVDTGTSGAKSGKEPMLVPVFFRVVDGKIAEITADPSQWNRHLDIQRSKCLASGDRG